MKIIQKITDKYYEYTPGEFLPIRVDGKVANMGAFHAYKLKKAALAMDRGFQRAIDRAYAK